MENYIVRIYRFEKGTPPSDQDHGVGRGRQQGKRGFTNLDDLWEILNSSMSGRFPLQIGDPWQGGFDGSEDPFKT